MLILDHVAYRSKNRIETAQFFIDMLNYKMQTEFDLKFDDGTTTECIVLESLEKTQPSIFISDGPKNSIVGKWVLERGGVGTIHHKAYRTDNIDKTFRHWKKMGIEFSSDIINCEEEDLRQVFTRPIELLGGMILELIERGPDNPGFCRKSVQALMESTKE